MHVAICDDNVADRKHIERLLSRESDKRAGTPNILYIDSYGDKDQFLRNPLMYNIVFMDMCEQSGLVNAIIGKLDEMGFEAPLVLYSSKIDYTQIADLPPYVIHQKKPYVPDPLPGLLALGDANVIGLVETVELHSKGVVCDVPKDEIMYVQIFGDKGGCVITYSDGRTKVVDEDISHIRNLLEHYDEFVMITKKTIVNFKFVTMIMYWTMIMNNHVQLNFSPLKYNEFRKHKQKIDELF